MNLSNKKILVTGASGLIGYNLLKKLLTIPNVKITATNHHDSNKTIENLKKDDIYFEHINFENGSLLTTEFTDLITKNSPDVVFHCAANSSGAKLHSDNPTSMSKDNTIMNLNLLDSCYKNGIKKFVWLASTTGYPDKKHPMKEKEMFIGDPFHKYFAVGWMKRYTEKLCQLYSEHVNNPITCIILRPSNVYGPNDKIDPNRSHVLTALVRKVVEKQNPIEVWGDGNDERDVLYVDDMVDAMLLAAEKIKYFDQFNIGYGKSYTVLQILERIKQISGYDAPHRLIPTGPRMIPVRRLNISKAKDVMGWVPKISLNEGLQKMYKWVDTTLNV